jgi:hypothetical protein
VSDALKAIDAKITKLEHSLQIGARKAPDKEVETEDDGKITVSGISSLEDLKAAFDNFSKKSRDAELRRAKAKVVNEDAAKPPEFSEEEDFSAKALTVVSKFSKYQRHAPKNSGASKIEGVFESPVMLQGLFNYGNTKLADVEVFNLGSGFFMFEQLPVLYCETGVSAEEAKARMQSLVRAYEKKSGVRIVIPDNERFFRDQNSPNIQFQVAMSEHTFNMLSPFKRVDQAAFPWAAQSASIGKPENKRSKLDKYIENHKDMVALLEEGVSMVKKERELIAKLNEVEDKIASEDKNIKTGMDRHWQTAIIENLKDDAEETRVKLRETRSYIRKLRTSKIELTKTLRDRYIDRKTNKLKKSKRS